MGNLQKHPPTPVPHRFFDVLWGMRPHRCPGPPWNRVSATFWVFEIKYGRFQAIFRLFWPILAYFHCLTGVSGFMRFEPQQVPRNTPVTVLWVSCGVLGLKYTLCSMFWAILGCFLFHSQPEGQTKGALRYHM